MTYRDEPPTVPPCPVCDRVDEVVSHNKPYQGRWLCMKDMLLFDGTSAEYLPRPPKPDITQQLAAARVALEQGAGPTTPPHPG